MSARRSLLLWLTVLCWCSRAALPVGASGQASSCAEPALTALTRAAGHFADDERTAADEVLRAAETAEPACVPLAIARLSLEAWTLARAAAIKGGSPESLARPRELLGDLRVRAGASPYRVHAEYAAAIVAAAMAAAQDERGELGLHLVHARALSERLQGSAVPPTWPLQIDEAEGELWLEVDDYAEACAAYRRWLSGQGHEGARATAARNYVTGRCSELRTEN